MADQRLNAYDNTGDGGKRVFMASNASWNAQDGMSKPVNSGSKINVYMAKQN